MRNHKKVAGALVVVVTSTLLLGGTSAPAQASAAAAAATCYGGAKRYVKADGVYFTSRFRTTSACTDINVKANHQSRVRVCFIKNDVWSCQANSTYTSPGNWTVVATNVRDNVEFGLQFESSLSTSGYIAA